MKRMLFPIIRKYWKLLLATMLITALGCGYIVGLSGSYLSLGGTLNDYLREYCYPDAVFTTEVTDIGRLDAIRQVPGVREVNARLCADTVLRSHDGRYLSVRVFSYNDDDLEIFHFQESASGGGLYSVYLEHNFAEENGLHAGDTLSFKVGEEWRELFVSGIVSMPETLAVQPTEGAWDLNADFGYAYASVHILEYEYDKVYEEAKEELDEKSGELDAAKEDADEELDSARKQLDEADVALREKEELLADSEMEASEKRLELLQTRADLEKKREELTKKKEQLETGRTTAQDSLDQLYYQRSRLYQASDGLAYIDGQLSTVIEQQNDLERGDVTAAVNLLRQAPSGIRTEVIASAVSSFQGVINSAQAYGFYYNVNDSVATVAAELRSFIAGVLSDSDYLYSEEPYAVLNWIESGEEGVEETPEYQNAVSVVSKYASVQSPEEFPSAYNRAVWETDEILSVVSEIELDASAARLMDFDATQSVASISAQIDDVMNAMAQLENAMGTTFTTVGEFVSGYDSAVSSLASARAQLESSRADVTDALAAQGLSEWDISGTIGQLNSGIYTLESTISEIDEGIPQIDEGFKQIDEGLKQIDEGVAEIDRQLAEAKTQIEEAKTELEEGESTYRESAADALLEFAELSDELANAYAELEEGRGYGELCNQFLLWFEDGADPEAVLKDAEAALGKVAVKSDYTFENSVVKKRIDRNLEPIGTMSVFIPAVFFAVLLAIVFLFMSLIVRQCRREIGILRALGFSVGSIRGLFSAVNLAVTLAAVILGMGIGIFLTWIVGARYTGFFDLPMYNVRIDWSRSVISSILAIAVGQLATLISTGFVLKISPAEAMSRPAPSTASVSGLLGRLTRKVPPMTAFSITTLFRNPMRFFFSVICVAASIMMIFASLAFFTSKDHVLAEVYGRKIQYDCQIYYSKPLTEETLSEIRSLEYVEDAQSLPYYLMDISFGDSSESALINALDQDMELVGIYDRTGRKLEPELSGKGIVLEEHLAQKLGARIGDTVLVDGRVAMRVEDISFQCASRSQYISREGAKMLGDESIGSIICRIDEKDEQKLLSYLVDQDDYLYTVFTRLAYEGNIKLLGSFDFAAWIIIVFAIGVGFIIVLNTARTNILEKKKELCVLRTLGFRHGEISRSWFSQCILQFIFSVILGFPMGRLVADIALQRLSSSTCEYVYANTPKEILITAAIVMGYIILSHFAAMHDMKNWDILESVKEKE